MVRKKSISERRRLSGLYLSPLEKASIEVHSKREGIPLAIFIRKIVLQKIREMEKHND